MSRPTAPLLKVSLVAALVIASGCGDGSDDEGTASGASVSLQTSSVESGAASTAEGPRTLSDMLPNAKWPWPEDSRAHSDILVLGNVTGARQGGTRAADPEPISADTPTVLVDFQVDRTISHDGEAGLLSDDIVTLEVVPGVPVGGTAQDLVDLYSTMGYAVFLLDLEGEPINDDVDGRVFWAGRATSDGGLRAPNGDALDESFARGIDTLDELEQQASKPEYAVDPEERRSDPEHYGG